LEDAEWLNVKPHKVIYASKRIPLYYRYIKKLLEMEKAYPCFCSREEFKKYRDSGIECPHRNTSAERSLEVWERMLSGEYEEGEVVIRIKTDMKHKDPAIRDWVAFRIVKSDHPLVGDRYIVYPTLDFESAIEDHILGITHIIRGKDLIDSERRQRYIYNYFGWKYPVTKHWGRVKIHEFGKLSTSEIRKRIESGEYEGWDDPALPTIRAFRRRGFKAEAIREFLLSLGVGENDVAVSLKNLYAENRKLVDKEANRYFFVWNPIEVKIEGLPEKVKVKMQKNPENDELRELYGDESILVTEDDWNRFKEGDIVRLKGFCTVRVGDKKDRKLEFLSWEMKGAKKGKNIVHWLSWHDSIVCVVVGDKPMLKWGGFVEKNAVHDVGKVVQFERFAFCKIEIAGEDGIRAIYTHP
jgi:glutamyl-tRNA synthetase